MQTFQHCRRGRPSAWVRRRYSKDHHVWLGMNQLPAPNTEWFPNDLAHWPTWPVSYCRILNLDLHLLWWRVWWWQGCQIELRMPAVSTKFTHQFCLDQPCAHFWTRNNRLGPHPPHQSIHEVIASYRVSSQHLCWKAEWYLDPDSFHRSHYTHTTKIPNPIRSSRMAQCQAYLSITICNTPMSF